MKRTRFHYLYSTLALFFGALAAGYAQIDIPGMGTQTVLNGYTKTLQGEILPYFSVYPDYAREALLTRCTDGNKTIEWETAPVPAKAKGPYCYFSWIAAHSTGTSGGTRHFNLYVNDRLVLTFATLPKAYPPSWSFSGPDSTRLVFEFRKQDGAADAHGIAYLRVPMADCTPGKPLRLKVTGQAENSNDWYMTFRYTFEEKIDVQPLPFLLRGNPSRQPLQFTVLHFGAPDSLYIRLNGAQEQVFRIQNGIQTIEVPVAAVTQKSILTIDARIGRRMKVVKTIELHPVIRREIELVHHSHTDIGYSHYQEEVAAIHTNNIRQALRMIAKTGTYPEGSRFVWNIESLWAVENFLRGASPTEIQSFTQAVRNGRIGLSALYANVLTGLCSSDELRWWTEYADTLRVRYGLPIRSAMFSDIPGLSWDAVSALAQHGVRYFSNGPNYVEAFPDQGDRIGSTLREQADKPFWWKSASGRDSILFWTCGRGYSSWHGFAPGAAAERGPRKIAAYLDSLEAKGYPYEMVQWRYNIVSDNGPIDTTISDFVRSWNEKYSSPRLVLANVNDVFERFEKQYGHKIPVWSGDFTPYWEDGAYSTAAKESANRLLSNRLSQLEQLARQQKIVVRPDWLYQAHRHILLFHEHTWGAWCSISQPDAPFTHGQWAYKERLLDSARYEVRRIEQVLFPRADQPNELVVTNTLSWPRSGFVEIGWPISLAGDGLVDEQGRHVPVQILNNGNRMLIAHDIPANGQRLYRAVQVDEPDSGAFRPTFSYTTDTASGAVNRLTAGGRDWVDPGQYGGLMEALYVAGRDPGLVHRAKIVQRVWIDQGPVLRRFRSTGTLEGAEEVFFEVSAYSGLDVLHCTIWVEKFRVREKESLHLAFPFRLTSPTVRIGVGDAWISPEQGQLPGSNRDFFSVQRWLDLSDASGGVTLSSPQGALFEVGSLIDERLGQSGYKKWLDRNHSAPVVFLYAMNNYWHTNYKADQPGPVHFDVYLHVHGAFDAGQAGRWGAEAAAPLIGAWKSLK